MKTACACDRNATGNRFPVRVWVLATLVLFPVLCGTTGSVSGVVKDASGAAIEGVRVTLTNTNMGIKSAMTTGKKGLYAFPTVLEGQYDLRAEAKGFKPQIRRGLTIHVNSAIRLDLTLDPEEGPI